MSAALIELQSASVRFGQVNALQSLSLRIHAGESIALVGGNGSGKTTLLRLIHGLIEPSTGSVRRSASTQAMMFQKPWMLRGSVLSNVTLAAWLAGGSRLRPSAWQQAKRLAQDALQRLDVDDLSARYAPSLSGGQLQRVAAARALVQQPQLLLLDEPTASLSPQARAEMEALMSELHAQGITLVFASHSPEQVQRIATRVLRFENGALMADETLSPLPRGEG